MEDVIDTSDVEEKEVLEAQKPGYYDKVWGMSKFPDGQNLDIEINDYPRSYNRMSQPQTPSHKKLQAVESLDPSPIFSRLKISLGSQLPGVCATTPVTTPVLSAAPSSTSTTLLPPESSLKSSSPDLGGFEMDGPRPLIKANDRNSFVDAFTLHDSSDSLQDPICLLSPISSGRSSEQYQMSRKSEIDTTQSRPLLPLSPLTPSPSMRSSFSQNQTANPPALPLSPILIPLDPEPQHRTYSLRHRSAKQLNPFEYDKRQYKRQLRGMPEAIVKDPNLRHAGRRERNDGGQNDWDQAGADADEDEDEDMDNEWRARERHRGKQLEREALKANLLELGIVLESSEDDVVLGGMGGDDAPHKEGHTRGKKRKKRPRVHRFPMATELENSQVSSSAGQPIPRPDPHLKPRPQPQPNYHGPSPSPQPQRAASIVGLDPRDDVRGLSDDLGDNMPNPWHVQTPEVEDSQLSQQCDKDLRYSPIPVDSSGNEQFPNPRRGRLKGHDFDEHSSDVQILEDNAEVSEDAKSDQASRDSRGSKDVILTEKARKQLKALRRMMPAALRNKLLANQEDKTKQRVKERPNRQESDASDAPLQPGRGRKRIVSPSSGDPRRFQIKGDTESEDESEDGARTTDREVIVVHDDEDEEDAERALEESENELDDEDIQTWLWPQETTISYTAPRIRRSDSERDKPRGGDLIDRMLQRTSRVLPQLPRTESGRNPQTKGPRTSIEVITKGAKRLGAGGGRQTKLSFPKADRKGGSSGGIRQKGSSDNVLSSIQGNRQHRVDAQDERCKTKKSKRRKRGAVESNLFIVHRDGLKITSGRPRQIIHIDDDDDAFHDALAPVESTFKPCAPQPNAKDLSTRALTIHNKFRHDIGTEPDAFDVTMSVSGQRHNKISLDFDMVALPSGLTLGSDSYIGKGRLYDLISVLKADKEVPPPFTVNLFGLQIDPDMPIAQISSTFASACDKLYDASTTAVDDQELPMTVKAADALMHALCHMVTFRALRVNDDDKGLLVIVISEPINHLIARINQRVELISADGHSMDYRSFALYWFSVEMHLRLVYAYHLREKTADIASTNITMHTAELNCVQLLRRLLEYGFDRSIGLLQNGQFKNTTSSSIRALELWICVFHIAPYLRHHPLNGITKPIPPFWRMVEAAMDTQANKHDSQLYESERIWRTLFSLCAISQFSSEGLSTSTPRLEGNWSIVRKALKCIRLSADVRDNSKPASTLHKRDTYLRLVTARCFLLCTRWRWQLNEADDMFQELCAIFRSRQFSNLLGEPDDFPMFIREGNEAFLDVHQKNDTAFGLFLKLIVRASKDFLQMDGTDRLRGTKLARLLSLAVPVGSTSFTKNSPPTEQGLSMLYNRYSAIFVSIYVDSSVNHIRSRLQQVRRYISFKDADYDSRTAAIRSMMHIAILLRHLGKPLDDILSWASEMVDNLIDDSALNQGRSGGPVKKENDKLVVLVQLLLGSIRVITNTPSLSRSGDLPALYPDIGLLQAWMSRILSNPMAKDHRTGLEICKCIQSFLVARRAIFPPPSLPKPAAGRESQESQDEYGDGGLDLNDPALLAVLADIEDRPDENEVADRHASEVLDVFSQPLYTCVCTHLGCKSTTFGGPYYEADQWLACWLSYGSMLVRNRKRNWNYYIQLGESAWKDISDPFRRIHVRLQFMLTVLQLDPDIYKSHGTQIQTLWFECIVSPEITIQHDFTARLFSIDGLRHAIFQNMPCTIDAETGFVTLDINEFKQHRLGFIEVALANVADAWNLGVGQYIPLVEVLLGTVQKWIDVINQDAVTLEYVEFGRKVILAVRRQEALTRHPRLQALLSQGGSL